MKVHLKDLIIVREIRQENGSMGTSEPESPRYHKVLYHELFARIGQDLNEKSEADRCLIHFECSINGIYTPIIITSICALYSSLIKGKQW